MTMTMTKEAELAATTVEPRVVEMMTSSA
jgi:hypothetical protein